jgi:hypothetical protein
MTLCVKSLLELGPCKQSFEPEAYYAKPFQVFDSFVVFTR